MINKLIIAFLLVSNAVFGQRPGSQLSDTLNLIEFVDKHFIDHDIDNYSLRLFTNYKSKSFRIRSGDYMASYTPNNRYGLGVGFANSKLLIDIAFNIKGNEDEVTKRFDMQGTTFVGKKNYLNFYLQTYKGFTVKNNFGAPSVFRDDIKSITVGFNTLHTFSDIEYSYGMLKAGLYRLDKKVYIKGGVGGFCFYDYFSAEGNVLPENSDVYFNEDARIKRYNSGSIGVLGGVLSIIKLTDNMLFACNIMPGVGGVYKHETLENNDSKTSGDFLLKTDYTMALGYNSSRFYISLIYGGGVYVSDLGNDNHYAFNLTKAKFAIGYKLSRTTKSSKSTQY
ncbi:DUF4421 family protein [Tamlana sp. I1]|uniref:DUF4421 family protein n=1 Tax=Tamlana sp. I1 TaxID=2762061 RepID=UPI00188EFD32|nr:DUF4421 family protein [Tamlana sp. I1]